MSRAWRVTALTFSANNCCAPATKNQHCALNNCATTGPPSPNQPDTEHSCGDLNPRRHRGNCHHHTGDHFNLAVIGIPNALLSRQMESQFARKDANGLRDHMAFSSENAQVFSTSYPCQASAEWHAMIGAVSTKIDQNNRRNNSRFSPRHAVYGLLIHRLWVRFPPSSFRHLCTLSSVSRNTNAYERISAPTLFCPNICHAPPCVLALNPLASDTRSQGAARGQFGSTQVRQTLGNRLLGSSRYSQTRSLLRHQAGSQGATSAQTRRGAGKEGGASQGQNRGHTSPAGPAYNAQGACLDAPRRKGALAQSPCAQTQPGRGQSTLALPGGVLWLRPGCFDDNDHRCAGFSSVAGEVRIGTNKTTAGTRNDQPDLGASKGCVQGACVVATTGTTHRGITVCTYAVAHRGQQARQDSLPGGASEIAQVRFSASAPSLSAFLSNRHVRGRDLRPGVERCESQSGRASRLQAQNQGRTLGANIRSCDRRIQALGDTLSKVQGRPTGTQGRRRQFLGAVCEIGQACRDFGLQIPRLQAHSADESPQKRRRHHDACQGCWAQNARNGDALSNHRHNRYAQSDVENMERGARGMNYSWQYARPKSILGRILFFFGF